jgi:hypothetical protein
MLQEAGVKRLRSQAIECPKETLGTAIATKGLRKVSMIHNDIDGVGAQL